MNTEFFQTDIVSELKNIRFSWLVEEGRSKQKKLLIEVLESKDDKPIVIQSIFIEKRYLFSLVRFIVRIAQKGFYRKKK